MGITIVISTVTNDSDNNPNLYHKDEKKIKNLYLYFLRLRKLCETLYFPNLFTRKLLGYFRVTIFHLLFVPKMSSMSKLKILAAIQL